MKEMQKDIGNIFREKFKNSQIPVHQEEWDAMSVKLAKMRFLRFSGSHFNVYYCFIIITSIGALAYWFFNDNNAAFSQDCLNVTENIRPIKVSKIEKGLPKFTAMKVDEDSKESLKRLQQIKHPPQLFSVESKLLQNDTLNNVVEVSSNKTELSPTNSPQDSTTGEVLLHHEIKTNREKNNNKKIVYVIKQDTIVVVDTLRNRKFIRKK